MHNKITTRLTITFCFITLILSGCDSISINDTQEEAPPVLSEQMFSMDLNVFEEQDDSGAANKEGIHFFNAAIRVVVVNHVVHSLLRVPFAVTAALQQTEPVLEEGVFVWETVVEDSSSSFVLRLEAQTEGDEVEWSMYITGVDEVEGTEFQNFLLYRVYSIPNSDAGRFELNYPDNGASVNVLNGRYENKEGDDYLLAFSSPQGIEDIGGISVTYQEEGNWFSLDVQNANDGTSTLILWDTITHAGSIEASDYNNGEKSCWDMFLRNADCSVAS